MSDAALVVKLIENFRSDLKNGRYPPDQNLSMQAVAKRYGVSRPLVRVAFKTMEGEGLLERRGDAYYAFHLSIDRLWQKYQLNRLIAKAAPQRFIALNPTATSLSIFDRSGDLVARTEQFFLLIAGLAGQHDFAMLMGRNNALLHRMFAKPDAAIEPDANDVASSAGLDGMLALNPVPHQYASLSYEEALREAYVDWRHGLKSNAGYRGIPFPKADGFEIAAGETVRLCQPYEILLRRRAAGGKLNIYVRGHVIELNDFKALDTLVDRVNAGAPVSVAELVAETGDGFPPEAVTYLLSQFSRFGGIEPFGAALAEA